MKRISAFISCMLLLGLIFAVERYTAYLPVSAEAGLRQVQLEEAQRMATAYPDAFGNRAEEVNLKATVQAAVARQGISVTYLSESEKDLGKNLREYSVLTRAVNVPHAKLVTFLAELEAKGGGAHIKEIHLKPSKSHSEVYEEAETVVSKTRTATDTSASAPIKERTP